VDIFTTQLTRVVTVPIKPTNLKVKALLKDSAANELKEDEDHLLNHYYSISDTDHQSSRQHGQVLEDKQIDKNKSKSVETEITQEEDHKSHLDIFV